jgi:hypothetical protein
VIRRRFAQRLDGFLFDESFDSQTHTMPENVHICFAPFLQPDGRIADENASARALA